MKNADEISESVEKAFNKVLPIFNKLYTDRVNHPTYKELLPAFAESLGYTLHVLPENTPRVNEKGQKTVLDGQTIGKDFFVYGEWGMNTFYFAYFHEIGHNLMHYNGYELLEGTTEKDREIEADIFALLFMNMLFPEHKKTNLTLARSNANRG
jgi:hypothetical protein